MRPCRRWQETGSAPTKYGRVKVRSFLAALLVALAPSLSVQAAHAATTCGTGQLCAVTKLTGSATGVVAARLTKPATVSFDAITLVGSGRVFGAAIVADVPNRDGAMVLILRSAPAYGDITAGTTQPAANESTTASLPAGKYRLYVFAD